MDMSASADKLAALLHHYSARTTSGRVLTKEALLAIIGAFGDHVDVGLVLDSQNSFFSAAMYIRTQNLRWSDFLRARRQTSRAIAGIHIPESQVDSVIEQIEASPVAPGIVHDPIPALTSPPLGQGSNNEGCR